jgi:nickel transport protein
VKPVFFSLCILTVLYLAPVTAFSHGVSVFAWAEDDTIRGESTFSGGRQVKKAEIVVVDATSGKTFLTTVTDEQGQFSFPIPGEARAQKSDLRIILQAGEAHRNEWIVEASEYLPEQSEKQIVVMKNREDVTGKPTGNSQFTPQDADQETFIRQLVKETVAHELGPIKQRILRQENQGPTLRDILGGIGVIFGIAGIVAYYKARRKRED